MCFQEYVGALLLLRLKREFAVTAVEGRKRQATKDSPPPALPPSQLFLHLPPLLLSLSEMLELGAGQGDAVLSDKKRYWYNTVCL